MKVEAKITLLAQSTNSVKALASITIENCFVVTGIRVVEGQNGYFTAMPNRKTPNGEYKDICFPITAEARAMINDEILAKYYEQAGKVQESVVEDTSFPDDLPF